VLVIDGGAHDFDFQISPELEGGVYANALNAWHSPHDFTLDFAAIQRPELVDPTDPESEVTLLHRIVVRVRVPLTMMFEFIREMNESLTRYEQEHGEIRRPQDR
jgi:Protein of unknown function (DUF3467)